MSIVYKIHECCKMAALIVASGSVLFFLSCAGDDRTAETHAEDMKTIKVDVENYISGSYDISDMLDTSFFIAAPLQTTPECLVGDDLKRIFYKNGFIYVLDKMTKGVYIFDVKGSMVGKIRSVGQGPEEYINLDDMYVTDKNVIGCQGKCSFTILLDDIKTNSGAVNGMERTCSSMTDAYISSRIWKDSLQDTGITGSPLWICPAAIYDDTYLSILLAVAAIQDR